MKLVKIFVVLSGILLMGSLLNPLWAIDERYKAAPLSGNQISKDSSSTVVDTGYANWRPLQTTYSVQNLITFKVNELANIKLPDTFNVSVRFKIYYTRDAGGTPVQDSSAVITLNIGYNKNTAHDHMAIYTFKGGYSAQVKITEVIVNQGTLAAFRSALMLENEILVSRSYTFNCTNSAVKAVAHNTATVTAKGELQVSWAAERTADEYDLEWTYVDTSALQFYFYPSSTALDVPKLFSFNATRVTVTKNEYLIPLLYDSRGNLYYRVRSVQVRPNGQRLESDWSTKYLPQGLGLYEFAGHAETLNWQATTSFAEEGKRKSVVSYFDGSLRSRQTVTKDNTTDTTLVAETYYDFQGRPAIQVLPAPSLSSIINYTPNFNTAVNGGEYQKDLYDGLLAADNYCAEGAPALDSANGTARYYSANNPNVNNSYHKYIPKASGFPYTETRYTPDNTDRVSIQSGVGPEYRIGTTHETRYFYSGADQEELDALFGTEVGNASHYFKNMVRDANGQYSVSYVDMHGRTVATALAGKPLSKLDTLTSSNVKTITKRLLDSNNNIIKGMAIESTKGLIVTRAGNQLFHYSLLPDSINIKDCNNIGVCYDCLYDLEITISDECNNSSLPGGVPYRITATNLSLDTNCNGNSFPAINESVFLREGSYIVSKKLTISKKGMDDYRNVFVRRNTCKTLEQFIAEQKQLLLNKPCAPTCNGCLDSLGTWQTFRPRYMREMGIPDPDTAAHRLAAWTSFTKMQQECKALCNELGLDTSFEQQMLADVTPPSGQYANPHPDSIDVYSIFTNDPMQPGSPERYRLPQPAYQDDNGQEDPLNPSSFSREQFTREFKSSWAISLLRHHPEYWKLKRYKEFAKSNAWDERFGNTETFQEAVAKGWLNPAAFTGLPANPIYNPANAENDDPLFTELAPQYKSEMQDSLFTYYTPDGEPGVSIWSLATIMAHCKAGDNACRLQYASLSSAFTIDANCTGELDMAWKNFREMYLRMKRKIIDRELQNYHNANGGVDLAILTGNPRHYLRFPDPDYKPETDPAVPETESEANTAQEQFIADNCAAYVQLWWDELKPCNYTTADTAIIFPRLRQVCREGGDAEHVFGSSTVKPSSTYQYRSFEDVLKSYDPARYNASCNAYLISAPRPYDQQPVYFDKPVYQKPDSCECATIGSLYGQYQIHGQGGTFSDYIYLISKTRIHDGVLDTLRKACKGEINCNYPKEPLSLPPILQCGVKNVCIDCTGVDTVYQKFKVAFPGITPVAEPADNMQQERNKLFENYMNHHLGFSKLTPEYLTFINACGADTAWRNVPVNISDNLTCDSVSYIFSNFQCSYNTMDDENVNRGKCKESIWAAFGRLNGVTPFMTNHNPYINAHVKDSIFHLWPDTTVKTVSNSTIIFVPQIYYAKRPISSLNNISFEIRVRAPSYNASGVRVNNTLTLFGSNGTTSPAPPDEDFTVTLAEGSTGGRYRIRAVNYSAPEFNNRDLGNWHIIKYDIKDSTFRLYYDGVMLKEVKRNGTSYIIYHGDFQIIPGNGARTQLDWMRIWRNDSLFYFEDFKGPSDYPFTRPDTKLLMPIPKCEPSWVNYFNSQTGKSLNAAQIRAYYWKKCGYNANPCPDTPLTLCGKTDPVFPPVTPDQRSPCDDSTLFSVSKGTLLYEAYRDSINDLFNDRYLSKCLNARYHETFTVEQQINEFHYTLYYYDQAGNLIKTIPPAGVDVSKFSWAVNWSDSVRTARKNKELLTPKHQLPTNYRYNSLNQVVAQKSPDGGQTEFWYDRLGRLSISQNAKQKFASTTETNRQYSYTRYDHLGRIKEVGQIKNVSGNSAMSDAVSRNEQSLNNWLQILAATREQITQTIYDEQYSGFTGISSRLVVRQRNLRNRVSYVTYADGSNPAAYNQATFYTYDVHGNVDTLLQDFGCGDCGNATIYNVMNRNGNRWKKIVYQYDLISGKVNLVAYNKGWGDQFFHRYQYDAENRITLVETSLDGLIWEKDARYEYYRHGPLARTVIGDQLVQGMDYAYTLQGWLKGINSTGGTDQHDMGSDGKASSLNQFVARDALAFNLNYFAGDYTNINNTVQPFPNYSARLNAEYKPLYNGNISSMASYIKHFDKPSEPLGGALFYNYRYDQLNRITGMDAYNGFNRANNNFDNLSAIEAFKERISYDGNGNILAYKRNGDREPLVMDSLKYYYYPGTNRLRRVTDSVPATAYGNNSWDFILDIDNQDSLNNYIYDSIGNLIADRGEKITDIKWNVYGKIQEITRVATDKVNVTKISFTYDASGNRISKISDQNGTKQYTWYVRDAQGNLLTTYTASGNNTNLQDLFLSQNDRFIYGSSRLGMYSYGNPVDGGPWDAQEFYTSSQFHRGWKQYELSNHLGNVMATISDRKIPVSSGGSLIDYYEPSLVSAQDYYPFGMLSRLGTTSTGIGYRYGFNGKEFDYEAKGWMNQYDYGERIYDNRIGRWLSIDPLASSFPYESPYNYAAGNPVRLIDADGKAAGDPPFWIWARETIVYGNRMMTNGAFQRAAEANGVSSIAPDHPRLGRIFEDAVLRSAEKVNKKKSIYPYPVTSPTTYYIPDAIENYKYHVKDGWGKLNYTEYTYEFQDAIITDAKFTTESKVAITDQIRGFIDYLADVKGVSLNGVATGEKNSDYGMTALVFATPSNVSIDQGILDYAKKKNVSVFQRIAIQVTPYAQTFGGGGVVGDAEKDAIDYNKIKITEVFPLFIARSKNGKIDRRNITATGGQGIGNSVEIDWKQQ